MPGWYPQRRGTAHALPNFCVVLCIFVLFYVLFVLWRSLYCVCVYVYWTTATGWLPNCSKIYHIIYAAPVWSNTSFSNYLRLQILQSKCLRVIGNYPRRTPIPRLRTALNVAHIRDFIYHLTDNVFDSCPAHSNSLVHSIGNYTLADLHCQYKKYTQKQPKHLLL
jgi:hypothetical protein